MQRLEQIQGTKTGLEVEMQEKGWVMGLSSEMEGGNQGV